MGPHNINFNEGFLVQEWRPFWYMDLERVVDVFGPIQRMPNCCPWCEECCDSRVVCKVVLVGGEICMCT